MMFLLFNVKIKYFPLTKVKYFPLTKVKYFPLTRRTWEVSDISIRQSASAESFLQTVPLLHFFNVANPFKNLGNAWSGYFN